MKLCSLAITPEVPGFVFGYKENNMSGHIRLFVISLGLACFMTFAAKVSLADSHDDTSDSVGVVFDAQTRAVGTFADDRIIPLDPNIYGGRYSSPAFYVEPRKFTAWLELATTAFDSKEGCEPKTPPLLSFKDIETRTKNLGSSLRNDPRLTKSRDCVSAS